MIATDDCGSECAEVEAKGVKILDPPMDMPWGVSALIGDLIYVCGGFENEGPTTDKLAAYDPLLNQWSPLLAPMPDARNKAQSTTDGQR